MKTNIMVMVGGAVALIAGCAGMAWAAPVIVGQTSATAFPVPSSSSNLLNTASGIAIGNFSDAESIGSAGNVGVLTNGTFGPTGITGSSNPEVLIIRDGATITYNFIDPVDITSISSYTGWRDNGRANQGFGVTFAQTVAPGTFNPLFSVNYASVGSVVPTSTAVVVTDSTGTLATSVSSLRFSFPTVQNGFVGYRELSVQGAVSTVVPEAGTGAFAFLGAAVSVAGLIVRRKR